VGVVDVRFVVRHAENHGEVFGDAPGTEQDVIGEALWRFVGIVVVLTLARAAAFGGGLAGLSDNDIGVIRPWRAGGGASVRDD
jgi:hypothetical protein